MPHIRPLINFLKHFLVAAVTRLSSLSQSRYIKNPPNHSHGIRGTRGRLWGSGHRPSGGKIEFIAQRNLSERAKTLPFFLPRGRVRAHLGVCSGLLRWRTAKRRASPGDTPRSQGRRSRSASLPRSQAPAWPVGSTRTMSQSTARRRRTRTRRLGSCSKRRGFR
jgi:hypothetical protein